MSSLTPWFSFLPHNTSTKQKQNISSWSEKEKRKNIYHGKPTEVTKTSDLKVLPWKLTKPKTELKVNKERRQTEPILATDRVDQKQGKKSLAVAHKKENNQLLKIKQSLENRKHLQEHKINQEEKKIKKLLLKPPRDHQSDNIPSVSFFPRNALKSMKIPPDDVLKIKESDVPKIHSNYLNNLKDTNIKLMGDTEDPEVVMSATPRIGIPRRNSIDTTPNPFMQDIYSSSRKGLNTKLAEPSATFQGYERKTKSLVERTPSIKPETTTRMLKPLEVLSCRYLRLSKNNIQTLLNLCKESGMEIDIHPHMNESELNANRIFNRKPSIAL